MRKKTYQWQFLFKVEINHISFGSSELSIKSPGDVFGMNQRNYKISNEFSNHDINYRYILKDHLECGILYVMRFKCY